MPGAGMSKGSGTRSGLLWEVERLLHECAELPQVLLMENVPQVVGSGAIRDFAQWLEILEKLGYKNYHRLMGVKKDDYERAAKHQSPSSQYHLAGDSIVTACLMAIFGELLQIDYNTKIKELTEELRDVD